MSYTTIKNGIAGILRSQGYQESKTTDFESQPASVLNKNFIITSESGEVNEGALGPSETISDRYYDKQEWTVKILFPKSDQNDVINRDQIIRAKDNLINKLDNPDNWSSYARVQKYLTWEIAEKPSFYVLTIKLKIIDEVIYT